MSNFTHFLITRFNVKNKEWENNNKYDPTINNIWLEKRYEIFTKFTFPSIKNQKCKNFLWLVYFDENTPIKFKDINNELANQFHNFTPRYIKNNNEFLEIQKQDFLIYGNKYTEYLIETRIDNDDCLHKSTICAIQKSFIPVDKTIIDLRKGLCMQIAPSFELRKLKIEFSHFLSLIEEKKVNAGSLLGVYSRAHPEWRCNKNLIVLDRNYYWIEIIHSTNLLNKIKGVPLKRNSVLIDFGLKSVFNFSVKQKVKYYFSKKYMLVKSKITVLKKAFFN